jgi:hypothetical protein
VFKLWEVLYGLQIMEIAMFGIGYAKHGTYLPTSVHN